MNHAAKTLVVDVSPWYPRTICGAIRNKITRLGAAQQLIVRRDPNTSSPDTLNVGDENGTRDRKVFANGGVPYLGSGCLPIRL
ncbi:MAG: hypothetical protein NVSMB53_16990 [Gemmatimonadaceae bacterium]